MEAKYNVYKTYYFDDTKGDILSSFKNRKEAEEYIATIDMVQLSECGNSWESLTNSDCYYYIEMTHGISV